MSKRNNDGDVIANRISLLEAKGQKLLASLYGSRPDWDSVGSAAKTQNDDDDQDLKQNYAHDRIGLGGVLPKDIEDGSFTKRIPTSDDKLLQQLIGKRKAKAHIAAKQEAARSKPATKAQQYAKQNVAKKEESDEEEANANNEDETKENVIADTQVDVEPTQDDDEEAEVAQPAPQRTKTKPKSFLDEILAERSKKKADKGK
ncbi:hypothetical protein Ptr902_11235 [Pyrenophora tritici-repentis]|uniref:DUF3245 domain containing protein n=1 Tax=Pyrenophora tritici-repentis TaxID=45151 RepID=A0A2W1E6F8_9PLEO|nr:hypothetical protein PtrV1_10927 [Pyrenophora tritici-repentis]KAF7566388.1 DUF3245 domain containing protein [Pyrenophora tritici-repentis]KAI0586325.1 hypothetical protein Alg215_02100 [Pyrenophora tritici-repentis]KAI0591974.1 hypothetical protein Alg130_00711 [Pyrenophora tritici-repentis]KAI0615180.1 hypothetical protein TUN205_00588 [Pyrenophora tritici-repentis]